MGGFRKGVNGRENHSGHGWEQRGLSRGLAAPSPVSVLCMGGGWAAGSLNARSGVPAMPLSHERGG